ncbi:MAG: endolytic transglycosylase MltG [Woeseiaceae bacterium]|nr:endolytic transglycosylase MltG [Woeseiaceae bacterium]
MTGIVKAIAVALAVIVVTMALGVWQLNRAMTAELEVPEDGATFIVEPGSSFSAVARDLVDSGFVQSYFWLRLTARLTGAENAIKAGEYHIEAGTNAYQLLLMFEKGAVQLHSFTIIEGWNRYDLLAGLHASEVIDASMTDEDWPAFLQKLGATETNPEGLFLPETYHFPRNSTDREILQQAYELMQEVLAEEWRSRGGETLVQTPYEALILASIIEKETARADERQRIAGVFTRRLAKRMRLQTDPTVIYGIGPGFNGNLTRKDLRTDTPYNTYTRHGLPPTPIAMPGAAAIQAALHPADGEELYFVATGLGDGSHKFSKTREEHEAAVDEYLKRLRQNRREGG